MNKLVFLILLYDPLFAQEIQVIDHKIIKDIQPNWPVIINNVLDDSTSFEFVLSLDSVQSVLEGYRVQVLATRYIERADSLAAIMKNTISDSVYVDFEAPNYKVRVGDFIDRDTAETLQQELVQMGYNSAWILRTRINSQASRRNY
ncbi:MAG: SPOR domain-containing protein [Candidatus Neomarinimicrobiota bacterium]|tara:strand:- start:131 stop:568 length:438 start_codon:yes stop_codon:yes gene_type:complete